MMSGRSILPARWDWDMPGSLPTVVLKCGERKAMKFVRVIAVLLLAPVSAGAQVIDGKFTPDGRMAAVKSCSSYMRGGKEEVRVAYWDVHSPEESSGYFDYFATFADGKRIQMEITLHSGSDDFETLLFDPAAPKQHFLKLVGSSS